MGRKNRGKRNRKKGTEGAAPRQQGERTVEAEVRAGASSSGAALSAPYHPGTRLILQTLHRGFPLGTVIPLFDMAIMQGVFMVRLDCGTCAFVPHDADVRLSDAPPLLPRFEVGARVECRLVLEEGAPQRDGEFYEIMPSRTHLGDWEPGTVVRIDNNWVMSGLHGSPYTIRFDSRLTELPTQFWGPRECIRSSNTVAPDPSGGILKYRVGTRVKCIVGEGEGHWSSGTVIKQWYRKENCLQYQPYQVQLDDGALIYVPVDSEEWIMPSNTPPPDCWICLDNEQTEKNLILRACACRGDGAGFAHVDCTVQLALHKVDSLNPKAVNPFLQCITCKSPFDQNSLIDKALARAQYKRFGNDSTSSFMHTMASSRMVRVMMSENEYGEALSLLTEQISKIEGIIEEGRPSFYTGRSESQWKWYLANCFTDLAEVHKNMGSLDKMKGVLDTLFPLLDHFGSTEKSNYFRLLADHSYTTGDKTLALVHLEKSLNYLNAVDVRALGDASGGHYLSLTTMLLMCGNLNLELRQKDMGVKYVAKAIKVLTKKEGKSPHVIALERQLGDIRQGSRETLQTRAGKLDVYLGLE